MQAREEQNWMACDAVFKYPGSSWSPESAQEQTSACVSKGQSEHVIESDLILKARERKALTALSNQ